MGVSSSQSSSSSRPAVKHAKLGQLSTECRLLTKEEEIQREVEREVRVWCLCVCVCVYECEEHHCPYMVSLKFIITYHI